MLNWTRTFAASGDGRHYSRKEEWFTRTCSGQAGDVAASSRMDPEWWPTVYASDRSVAK